MSGLTTTGATVLSDFSVYGRGMFFWRGLTHWLGGMGVIALFVAILPRLAIGGRELFFAEAPGPTDKVSPQIRRTAAVLWRLYVALTAAAVVALLWPACPCSTRSATRWPRWPPAASPRTRNRSRVPPARREWTLTLHVPRRRQLRPPVPGAVATIDAHLPRRRARAYTGIVIVASRGAGSWCTGRPQRGRRAPHGAVPGRIADHDTGSPATTSSWESEAGMVLLVLMFIGGCAGSAAGGLKVVRLLLLRATRCRSCAARCIRARCCR